MNTLIQYKHAPKIIHQAEEISDLAKSSFTKIAPFWPLQNIIAVNPLLGFEDLPIEDAIKIGSTYFEQSNLPEEMALINIETIKWLQVYFDEGQATITMPLRKYGLYTAWRKLVIYDEKLHKNKKQNIEFLNILPKMPEQAIAECLLRLGISREDREQYLTLLLTTLPGWASYIKYRTEWAETSTNHSYGITQIDYLAIRLIITSLLWPQGKKLLYWHKQAVNQSQNTILEKIQATENSYMTKLLKKLISQTIQKPRTPPKAQIVFCIDVRSESFRKSIESMDDYQTLGFAGFFGIPVQITDKITGNSYPSCPVMLKPKHNVIEAPYTLEESFRDQKSYELLTSLKRLYQHLKYNFSTPFVLAEALGIFSGTWMGLKTISPNLASKFRSWVMNKIRKPQDIEPSLNSISFKEQCKYAEVALRMMGLTQNFAPLIVFCGHGSKTQNNAYATALDCGACGGRHGASNARILAAIMNRSKVKMQLAKNGIHIPETTLFIAAEHNTTTDEVVLYCKHETEEIKKLKHNLKKARSINSSIRLKKMSLTNCSTLVAQLLSEDWAQVRPEWGLSRNAAFIVAPRDLTYLLDLDGRCFLHSYDYKQDPQGTFLTTILTAPMVVAEWINMQYLFSTINNVAYGCGSKITKNITGKIGIMQGNASDLMTGLPLQSLYNSDTVPYHEPQRLIVIVLAPKSMLDKIIQSQPILKKLFSNGWVRMTMIEPMNNEIYLLNRDLSWQQMH